MSKVEDRIAGHVFRYADKEVFIPRKWIIDAAVEVVSEDVQVHKDHTCEYPYGVFLYGLQVTAFDTELAAKLCADSLRAALRKMLGGE